jgi:hypothetical protein
LERLRIAIERRQIECEPVEVRIPTEPVEVDLQRSGVNLQGLGGDWEALEDNLAAFPGNLSGGELN